MLGPTITEFRPPPILAHTTAFILIGLQKPVQWLFPNLRSVEWQFDPDPVCCDSSMLSLVVLLGPRVESVTVMQVNPMPEWASALLLDELRAFALSRTNLKHFKVYCTQLAQPMASLVPDVIKENKELRTLEVWQQLSEPLPRTTWLEVARLPKLEKTLVFVDEFLGTEDEQPELRKLSEPLFPFLLQVTIHTDEITGFSRLLDFIHSSSLENIALIVTEPPTNEEVKTLFTKLTKHRSHASMRYLTFKSAFSCPRDDDSYIITADTLRLLLPLRNLVTCTLAFHCPMRPDDAFLSDAATAWGETLMSLDIGTGYRRRMSEPPAVTLTGLTAIATKCLRLAHLGVEFTPNVEDFQEAYDAGVRPCQHGFGHVGRLSVGASTLGDLNEAQVITLAGILSDLFPMIIQIESLWEREEDPMHDEDPDDEQEREAWRKVWTLTEGMVAIRLQERLWASLRGDHDAVGSDSWMYGAC